ncbi:mechanosensitive ion channel family protein [Alicyclobacillus tolerans]|uniref:Small-conductance mechanosensitive channel n=2 Tax=Alicyclobacillus tolerans TaxID=90970 RepID=A0ABT9LXZ8_9BACL|nr:MULTISPECIES: mechanosensitive ion channel family protein [Alicyclobacillus]MDP9729142.1 small-conductance mechanosensitive channel [Alicyclobacillus tengchongensis]QRF22701.1 mechanosensitive ion channel family protein [Alicyclobacillus sp. TC]SHK01514.1 Small-conductance mechanosensitive channel [Alicyclobacillus montanus]
MKRSPDGSRSPRLLRNTILSIVILIVVSIAIMIGVDTRSGFLKHIPKTWLDIVKALLVFAVGGIVSTILERNLFRISLNKLGPQRSTLFRYVARLLLFLTVIISALTAFGVGLPSVIFGGTFITVIVGLAGQTVFANIIGGIWLLLFRPFRVGDPIGIVAWQFPLLMPSYPHEAMRPMYFGVVRDINLMYTEIESADGYLQMIPNGIIAQSFLENKSTPGKHRIHFRFDVDHAVPVDTFLHEARIFLMKRFNDEDARPEVWIADIGPATYSIRISLFSDDHEEALKSEILQQMMRLLQQIKKKEEANAEQTSN